MNRRFVYVLIWTVSAISLLILFAAHAQPPKASKPAVPQYLTIHVSGVDNKPCLIRFWVSNGVWHNGTFDSTTCQVEAIPVPK